MCAERERKPNLKLRRARGDMSQARLADLVNAAVARATGRPSATSAKSISDWERGWYTWPDTAVRAALCEVLGAPDAAALGFENRRATRPSVTPPREDPSRCLPLVDLGRDAQTPTENLSACIAVPGGRAFPGAGLAAVLLPVQSPGRPRPSPHALARLTRSDRWSVLLAHTPEGDVYLADGREYATSSIRQLDPAPVPDAYRLDDLTIGIIWSVSNTDAAILADDGALDSYQRSLAHYQDKLTSSASVSEAPMLNNLSRQWLGSHFCTGHITRHLSWLTADPLFWDREQRGEEAASWLLWNHKLDYLRYASRRYARARRGFCIPEHEVRASPKYERVLLLLAMALMEACGIEAQVSPEPQLGEIEGFVLADDVIVANWLRAPGLWYVDTGAPPSRWATYRETADHVAAHSIIAHPTPSGRLQAMAAYLGIQWAWFVSRCRELATAGVDGLAHPRSRHLSTDGLTIALNYVAHLDDSVDP